MNFCSITHRVEFFSVELLHGHFSIGAARYGFSYPPWDVASISRNVMLLGGARPLLGHIESGSPVCVQPRPELEVVVFNVGGSPWSVKFGLALVLRVQVA
mmetsp:Transcript_18900/g.8812  ORF Transcript_18900/g.8812 Transcript_18900/m.8812 type:complete len:100 (+) Transcript_18900:533-832(+)